MYLLELTYVKRSSCSNFGRTLYDTVTITIWFPVMFIAWKLIYLRWAKFRRVGWLGSYRRQFDERAACAQKRWKRRIWWEPVKGDLKISWRWERLRNSHAQLFAYLFHLFSPFRGDPSRRVPEGISGRHVGLLRREGQDAPGWFQFLHPFLVLWIRDPEILPPSLDVSAVSGC